MRLISMYTEVHTPLDTVMVKKTVYAQYDKAVSVVAKDTTVPCKVEHLITYVQSYMRLRFNTRVRFISNLSVYMAGTGKIGSFSLKVDGVNLTTGATVFDTVVRVPIGTRTGYDIVSLYENCNTVKALEDFESYRYSSIKH